MCLLAGEAGYAAWFSNPGFEIPYTTGWFAYTPESTTNSTDFAQEGSQALKLDTLASDRYTVVDHPLSAAVPGAIYTVTASYYLTGALLPVENLGVGIRWLKLNGSGQLEFTPDSGGLQGLGPIGTETVGEWEPLTFSATAPADAEYIMIQLEVTGAGSPVYFDNVSVDMHVPLSLQRSGADLMVDFVGMGVLQRSSNLVAGSWSDMNGGAVTNGPFTISPTGDAEAYRLREP